MEEKNECPNLIPMRDWITQDSKEGECKPCMLGPVTAWYDIELRGKQQTALADELVGITESATPEELASKLDEVKAKISDPELVETLRGFDCFVQTTNTDNTKEEEKENG